MYVLFSNLEGEVMGLFYSAINKRISKFILEFTGQYVVPIFHTPCHSSISIDWDGWCAIDSRSIWLVNKWEARGVQLQGVSPGSQWGQYPHETRGFPKYLFEFRFNQAPGGFTIYPKTATGGAELNQRLNAIYNL